MSEHQKVTIHKRDCVRAIREVRLQFGFSARHGRLSKRFERQIALNAHFGALDFNMFMDRLAELEGSPRQTGVKPPERFTKGPLIGLWRAHWFQASFMVRNLLNAHQQQSSPPGWRRIFREHKGERLTREIIGKLVKGSVDQNYENRFRQKQLTGEWIIFAKTGKGNRYLSIALHSEDQLEIARRCEAAAKTFPEVEWTSL